jgi:hypothetical protein
VGEFIGKRRNNKEIKMNEETTKETGVGKKRRVLYNERVTSEADLVVGDGKEGKMFLNEIDVFPVAVTFIDDYVTGEHYIQNMAELTYKYLLEHSKTEMPWPM